MALIDKDQIRAEIERYKQGAAIARFDNAGENADYFQGKVDSCDDLTHIIDSLPEQPVEGLEEAAKDTIERTCKWLFAHLPLLVYYYDEDVYTNADRSDFIKQFRTQMEDEK